MLRITMLDQSPSHLVLRLEGRLEGPWVSVLAKSWDRAAARAAGRRLLVDLNGVTFVDAAGKTRLADLHRQGAEFTSDDQMTRAIVAEIVEGAQ